MSYQSINVIEQQLQYDTAFSPPVKTEKLRGNVTRFYAPFALTFLVGTSMGIAIGYYYALSTSSSTTSLTLPYDDISTVESSLTSPYFVKGTNNALYDDIRPFRSSSIPHMAASTADITLIDTTTTTHLDYLHHASSYDKLNGDDNTNTSYSYQYYIIESGIDVQKDQTFCGVATAATILNSLRFISSSAGGGGGGMIHLPIDPAYAPYRYMTQVDLFFDDCVTSTVISSPRGVHKIPPVGLTLSQVELMLNCYLKSGGWYAEKVAVNPDVVSLDRMREDFKRVLANSDERVLINYSRAAVGQVGGGHFSPLGSYHTPTDSFLIVDVAKYKYPPVWVSADVLYQSLATVDTCGIWQYPQAQSNIPDDWKTRLTWQDVRDILGCREEFRGYILVKRFEDNI